jgi:hypothetical protein
MPQAEAAALQTETFEQMVAAETWHQPWVINVAEQERHDSLLLGAMQFLGRAAVDPETLARETPSLMAAIHRAAEGDPIARQLVTTNVRADMVERTIKTGHISKTNLEVDDYGRILQFGQTTEQIMANSLAYGSQSWQMRERTSAEARNKFRIDRAYANGSLENYVFVVLSRAADNMDAKQMDDEGFFTDTMSLSVQATALQDGRISVESAFVAGKPDREAAVQDADMVEYLAGQFGQDFSGKTATETLDTPLLVHKDLMPNGVIDLVKILDEYSGTFFGEAKPAQDYETYQQQCAVREMKLDGRVEAVVNQLVKESEAIKTPQDATERLGKLSALEMVEEAVVDKRINPRVFGVPAAFRIEHARYAQQNGDHETARRAVISAQAVEISRSCPGAGKNLKSRINESDPSNAWEDEEDDNDTLEDCDFVSEKCPVCGEENAKTKVRRGVYYHVGRGCKG